VGRECIPEVRRAGSGSLKARLRPRFQYVMQMLGDSARVFQIFLGISFSGFFFSEDYAVAVCWLLIFYILISARHLSWFVPTLKLHRQASASRSEPPGWFQRWLRGQLRVDFRGLGRAEGAHPVFSGCGQAEIQAGGRLRSKSILSAASMSRSLLQSQCFVLSSASLRLRRRRYSQSSGGLCFGFPPGLPGRLGRAFKANASLAFPARVVLFASRAHCCAFCLSR